MGYIPTAPPLGSTGSPTKLAAKLFLGTDSSIPTSHSPYFYEHDDDQNNKIMSFFL